MLAGARSHRGELPVLPISLREGGAVPVATWVRRQLEQHRRGTLTTVDVGPPVPHVHLDEVGHVHRHAH
jgi:hypothetical protein